MTRLADMGPSSKLEPQSYVAKVAQKINKRMTNKLANCMILAVGRVSGRQYARKVGRVCGR
jgi:hypothetical protein